MVLKETPKLSLAVRKNIRDEYDSKLPDFDSSLSTKFKTPWTYSFDAPAIYADASPGMSSERPGAMMAAYIQDFEYQLDQFLAKYGDEGLEAFNAAANKHTVTLERDSEKRFSYCGCDIKDGIFRLLYAEGNQAVNIGEAAQYIGKAIDNAEKSEGKGVHGLDFLARMSVKNDWATEEASLEKKLRDMVKMEGLKLEPGFVSIAKMLSENKNDVGFDNWEPRIGETVLEYYKSLVYNMEREGFDKDDLLQEGFQEMVTENAIGFRVVQKLVKSSYNETIVEGGKLWIQTTPKNWYTNVGDVGAKLIDSL